MSEVNADVLAQMKRIWSAVNDGTVDKAAVNDALKLMHDFLSGAAYEAVPEAVADEGNDGPSAEGEAGEGEDHPRGRSRKKK